LPEARNKAQRRADREAVGAYHEAELGKLLDRVRAALASYDAGEIDAFKLDDLIHHYKRAAQKLWSACVGAGGHVSSTARLIEWQAAEGEETDWWEMAAPRRR
jgi:hypothetical protein